MATIVLTAAGSAVGGPIGAAIGAIIGQQIDARLFAPKAREGPRLGDLAVQTSSYGSAIPKLFGTMRVAGTVIWATDLQEHRSRSGGGKARPKTVDYSYSASFAVALSGRPIRAIRRIWADGKLLRGAGGDFKSETGYRLHLGDEAQAVDPMIAAAEGPTGCPAYRGIAYAVFEDFQLGDYGNRIPLLTFEVEADSGPVSIGAIAETLSAGAVANGSSPAVGGYAASGDSVRGAIEALSDVVPLSLIDEGSRLRLTSAADPDATVVEADMGASATGNTGGRSEFLRRAAGSVPGQVSIAYYDPARDFQTGLQRASRTGATARVDRRAWPAALGANVAKGLAEQRLAALWAGRATAKLHLSWRRSGLRPGAHVTIEGRGGLWKVERWTLDRMVVSLELVRVLAGTMPPATASAGRSVAEPDLPHGPTTLRVFESGVFGDMVAGRPQLLVAAAGIEVGWRRAALLTSSDGGASWEAAGSTAGPAVIGTASSTLAPASAALLDLRGSIDVELLNEAMWLEGRSDDALAGGANLALVGDELIQFGVVDPIGDRRFRLSRLLRGRRGTEWAMGEHGPGDGFVLLDRCTLAAVEPLLVPVGGEVRVLAVGIGDAGDGVVASCVIEGEAMRPPSPVHLAAERLSNGDIMISWVRRSRMGWAWISGSDAPLGEEREAYLLTLSWTGFTREVAVDEATYLYSTAQQAADGLAGEMSLSVVQVGTVGRSRAEQVTFPAP